MGLGEGLLFYGWWDLDFLSLCGQGLVGSDGIGDLGCSWVMDCILWVWGCFGGGWG